jgi:DNA-binding protein Fis
VSKHGAGGSMREDLERLIDEMVTKGIRYEDAQQEFEKRFIARVLVKADGNLCRAADLLGIHRNTLSRKIAEYRLRA